MRRTHVVGVDYESLVSHLKTRYGTICQDEPLPRLAMFHHYRGILADHVDGLMDEDNHDSDPHLTQILLKEYIFGAVTDILVSMSPGRVVFCEEQAVILPLILIEVDY